MKTKTIFIQIPSYRDPELIPTLHDCIAKAEYPDRLRFGICHQSHNKDTWDNLDEFIADSRFKIEHAEATHSKGLGWARTVAQKMYDGEDYILQLDSHHRFKESWDSILITTLNNIDSPKPIITGYLPAYISDEPVDPNKQNSTNLCAMDNTFNRRGLITFIPKPHNIKTTDAVWPARFMCGHFLFTTGEFNLEHHYDPDVYFCGEEMRLSVMAFTLGYDMYHMRNPPIWHQYGRVGSVKHWNDKKSGVIEADMIPEKDGFKRLSKLFSQSDNASFGNMGLGNVRSMLDFENYASINFSKQSFKECVKYGGPVNQGKPSDKYVNGTREITIIDTVDSGISKSIVDCAEHLNVEVNVVNTPISIANKYSNTTFIIINDTRVDFTDTIKQLYKDGVAVLVIDPIPVDGTNHICRYINVSNVNDSNVAYQPSTEGEHIHATLSVDIHHHASVHNKNEIMCSLDVLRNTGFNVNVVIDDHTLDQYPELKDTVELFDNLTLIPNYDRRRSIATSKAVVTLYSDDEILAGIYNKPLITLGYNSGKLVKSVSLLDYEFVLNSIVDVVSFGNVNYSKTKLDNIVSSHTINIDNINANFIISILRSNIPERLETIDNDYNNYVSKLWIQDIALRGERVIVAAPDIHSSKIVASNTKLPTPFDFSVLCDIKGLSVDILVEDPVKRFIRKFNVAYKLRVSVQANKNNHPTVPQMMNMVRGKQWDRLRQYGLIPQFKLMEGIESFDPSSLFPVDKLSSCGEKFDGVSVTNELVNNGIREFTPNEIRAIKKVYGADMKLYQRAVANYRRNYE